MNNVLASDASMHRLPTKKGNKKMEDYSGMIATVVLFVVLSALVLFAILFCFVILPILPAF